VPVGPVDPSSPVDVTVVLRPSRPQALRGRVSALARRRPATRSLVTRPDLAAQYGPAPEGMRAVETLARASGLEIVDTSMSRRCVCLTGPADAAARAFGTQLQRYERPDLIYRGRVGLLHVPADLRPYTRAVVGLDDRPQARTQFRLAPQATVTYTPLDLGHIYAFPAAGDATGMTIAIVELGGGYVQADLEVYFGALGLPVPVVEAIEVDGGTNAPDGDTSGPDAEVMLDIEVAAGLAPGARIAVYFAPNTDRGFLDVVTGAIHDDARRPSVVSISWGAPESQWTLQAMSAMDQAFADGAALGVTVCCAAGDNGSSDGVTDGQAHADFPASSPHALACGGTRLVATSTQVTSETVWNGGTGHGATGGGVSAVFSAPSWQAGLPVPASPTSTGGRGVPDVSGDADPQTGYRVRVDGQDLVIGGTSAVSPLWAALSVRLAAAIGAPTGYLAPLLYEHATDFRDITSGTNGAYAAGVGWDACTGLGSPDGERLAVALASPDGSDGEPPPGVAAGGPEQP